MPSSELDRGSQMERMDDFGGFVGAEGKSSRQLWMIYRGLNRMPSQRGVIDLQAAAPDTVAAYKSEVGQHLMQM